MHVGVEHHPRADHGVERARGELGVAFEELAQRRIHDLAQFDDERLQMLIETAVAMAPKPIDSTAERTLFIKSVSEKQRSRR